MNAGKSLLLEDVTKKFKNYDSKSPRSLNPTLERTMQSLECSFQCGNSWFFLGCTGKGWPLMYELDMEHKEWKSAKSVGDNQDDPWGASGMYSVVSNGEKAYWYGGSDAFFYTPLTELKVFDPALGEWRAIKPQVNIDSEGGEHPSLEYCDSTIPLETDHIYDGGPCLFTFGGYNDHELVCYNNLYRFDIQSKTWTTMNSVIKPNERCHSTMVHLRSQKKLLMYGGGDMKKNYDDLWTFDLSEERTGWQQVSSTGESPVGSTPSVVTVIRGPEPQILVVRESDTTQELLFYLLDCLTLHWTILNSHIRVKAQFISIFQLEYQDMRTRFFLYVDPPGQPEQVFSVSINTNRMLRVLHESSLRNHLCDVIIKYST